MIVLNNQLQKLVDVATDELMYQEVLKTMFGVLKNDDEANAEIRFGLSVNKNCPVEVLEKLVKDDIEEIRINAVRHQKATSKILSQAVKDPSSRVRLAVLDNPSASESDLWQLMQDTNLEIVEKARLTLKTRL